MYYFLQTNITNCVKNGRSFFGLLNQEIIQKVHNFWELHNRIIESRKNRIAPPIRMYTPNTTTTTTTGITTEQNASNTDEIDEDILLDEEPEIRKLMSNLIAAGCNLNDLLGNASQQSAESIERNTDYSTLTIERRRHRQLRLWFTTEAERPFTPKYFNICRPNFIDELKRLNDSENSDTYKLLHTKNDKQTGNGAKNEGTERVLNMSSSNEVGCTLLDLHTTYETFEDFCSKCSEDSAFYRRLHSRGKHHPHTVTQ
ncbi:unnamed protein product [Trichobilharzia regenti]|nr:unnamed protein product [Trichobilharzia regenti]